MSEASGDREGDTPSEQDNSPVKDLPGTIAFLGMGLTAAVIIAIFVFVGIWADRSWGTAPWGLLIGIALGTVAAVVSVVKQVRRFL